MSGRIRTVKPEWLDDTKIGEASLAARVLSIGLILMADDYGNGRLNKAATSRIFPHEPAAFEPALVELEALGFAMRYTHSGQHYFHVINWSKHQRVDKPGKPLVPSPSAEACAAVEATPVAYFVRSIATGLIKVGKSIDPVRRLLDLAKQSPDRLELLAVGGSETELHRELAASRVHGEWFKPSPEVMNACARYGFDGVNPISAVGPENLHKTPVENLPGEPENLPVVPVPDLDRDLDLDQEGSTRASPTPPPKKAELSGPELGGIFGYALKLDQHWKLKPNSRYAGTDLAEVFNLWLPDMSAEDRSVAMTHWVQRWLKTDAANPKGRKHPHQVFIDWCTVQEGLGEIEEYVRAHHGTEVYQFDPADDLDACAREMGSDLLDMLGGDTKPESSAA